MPKNPKYVTISVSVKTFEKLDRIQTALEGFLNKKVSQDVIIAWLIESKVDWTDLIDITAPEPIQKAISIQK